MRDTWIASDNIISPLGNTTAANYEALHEKRSGIALTSYSGQKENLYLGKIADASINIISRFTRFESLCIQSAKEALGKVTIDASSHDTVFILSTTKGNIDLLEEDGQDERINLFTTAKRIASFFGNSNKPVVVSQACISGVKALLTGRYLIQSGQYNHVIIIGADILSRFVVSGFQSLQAMSTDHCRPFDKDRKGINLGEAAATVVLSATPETIGAERRFRILGGATSNDANHISGPSRTGEELMMAINQSLAEAKLNKEEIDFISAHGTATLYNDEMESKAFYNAGLSSAPVNSLKGYFGHTLGAAGLLESVISVRALEEEEIIPTLGYHESGVSHSLNIATQWSNKKMKTCLKTASGFGGCNASMVLQKMI